MLTNLKINAAGDGFTADTGDGTKISANFDLYLIKQAWGDADYEDLADGFGAGAGTMGDWSGIRDSSPEARAAMLERALNALFGEAAGQ